MTDIHSHILPKTDDGSSSVKESLSLLSLLKEQGVDLVAATPHFYADDETPDIFLERRERHFLQLKNELPEDSPQIVLGAEVLYYPGISRTERLDRFKIGDSNLILIEMPFSEWTDSVIREISDIQRFSGLDVLIAHFDRYISHHNLKLLDFLKSEGVYVQVNADSFFDKRKCKKVLDLIKNRIVDFIGSDCHDTFSRPPLIGEAYKVIEKKLGELYIKLLNDNSQMFFESGDT